LIPTCRWFREATIATAERRGYKQSGNGREYGKWALDEFLEIKGVVGYEAT